MMRVFFFITIESILRLPARALSYVVTITAGFSYSNRNPLDKRHFLDLVCATKSKFMLKRRRKMPSSQPCFAWLGGVNSKAERNTVKEILVNKIFLKIIQAFFTIMFCPVYVGLYERMTWKNSSRKKIPEVFIYFP